MRKNTIQIVSLGCSKNLVDSEVLMNQFAANGFKVEHNADRIDGEIVVVNTCGFIRDAQEESINTILRLANAKKQNQIDRLYVMGCLSERFLDEMKAELPEVDKIYGKFNWKNLLGELGKSWHNDVNNQRIITTPPHYTYLKISEGCNRHCAFCAIPLMTGHHKSVPIEDLLAQVHHLVAQGVREFNVIAQDLSSYGLDLYKEQKLAELIERMAQIPGVEWIRLHYAYPSQFPYDILPVMRKYDNVCKYLDIALQHINDQVLSNMQRRITRTETLELLSRIREEVPGIHLRTTLMVGFPGETDEAYNELLDFVRTQRFERLGAFSYSEEEGTYGARHFVDDIPAKVKQQRLNTLTQLQETIYQQVNNEKIGTTQRVIIDREDQDYYIGRTQYDSPDVDTEVLVTKAPGITVGQFCQVRITEALPYELYGVPTTT